MMKPLTATDVKISRGESVRKTDNALVVKDCLGRPVSVWTGATISRQEKESVPEDRLLLT